MSKKNLILIIIFFSLLLAYGAANKYIISKRNISRSLAEIELNKVQGFNFFNGKEEVALKKDIEGFIFETPFRGIRANREAVEKYINNFSKLSLKRDLGAVDLKKAEEYGITGLSRWIVFDYGNKQIRIDLGGRNPVDLQNYVMKEGNGRILLTERAVEYFLSFRPEEFREKKLLVFEKKDVNSFVIKKKGALPVSFEKTGKDWYLKEGMPQREYPAIDSKIDQYLDLLTRIEIRDFKPYDDEFSTVKCGLKYPLASLILSVSSDTLTNVDVGNKYNKDSVYISLNGKVVGGVNNILLRALSEPATSFIKYDILDILVSSIASFESRGGDIVYKYIKVRGRWYRTGKKKREIEREKVNYFLQVLSMLKADKFFFDGSFEDVKKEFVLYNRKGEVISHIIAGTTVDGFVKLKLKDKKGVMGVSAGIMEMLVL